MKPGVLSVVEFLKEWRDQDGLLMDSRSETEFQKGHIPGAFNLPLLNDEHRKIIGTLYRQKGRQDAILKGFELVGPKFHELISEAMNKAAGKPLFIYCWRGGMRSNISAWLLGMAGMNTRLLEGGYKSFRNHLHTEFDKPRVIRVLGGKTGSGKTELLPLLADEDHQVIDLENLAGHKGSAFGALGLPEQPTQEHFENLLGFELMQTDPEKLLWFENESRQIGNVNLPNKIYDAIRTAAMIAIDPGEAVRKKRILAEYGTFPVELLSERTKRIGKRLGNQHLQAALNALASNDLETWLNIILVYYDKSYVYGNELRNQSFCRTIDTSKMNLQQMATEIKEISRSLNEVI